MTTSERPVIEARSLTKVYKLYDKPQQKFLDMMGLLRTKTAIAEHYALDGVDLSIGRGERVGIIGRNGAGKSTLLKLISGVIEPTRGSLHVDGSARALLEIGTGFHPEFSGRENVKAYLAQIGIAGRRGEQLLGEIVDFAELEEYIEQPLKTYSTGMAVRLMFATSTAVAPELLILDEVLGVGDAYFTRKSFDRIEEMCRRDGATLLLVSHDIYTSAKLCERMIWLERGRIVFDGDPNAAIKVYEDSIREQEEHRLRRKTLQALERARTEGSPAVNALYVELAFKDGQASGPVRVARLGLEAVGAAVGSLPLHDAAPATGLVGQVVFDQGCWGEAEEYDGRPCRPMLTYGSPYRKVAGVFDPAGLNQALDELTVVADLQADAPVELLVRAFTMRRQLLEAVVSVQPGSWQTVRGDFSRSDTQPTARTSTGVYGTGAIEVLEARVVSPDGRGAVSLRHGEPAAFEFRYRVVDPDLDENCDVILAVLRGGVETVARYYTRDVRFFHGARPGQDQVLRMALDPLRFGTGSYQVTLLIARAGYVDQEAHVFYTLSPDVYVTVRDVLEFTVTGGGLVASGTGLVDTAAWSSAPADAGSATTDEEQAT